MFYMRTIPSGATAPVLNLGVVASMVVAAAMVVVTAALAAA